MPDSPPPTIIVVDDDAPFRALLHEVFTEAGYTVLGHASTPGLHQLIHRTQPGLVLLDIHLEYPDAGWFILDVLRRDPATQRIPVIVCTADGARLRAKPATVRAQADAIITKPFALDALLALAGALISRTVMRPGYAAPES